MLKFVVVVGALLAAGPAAAGCADYEKAKAPAVSLCLNGKCSETWMEVECANGSGVTQHFANGVSVSVEAEGKRAGERVIVWNDRRIRREEVTCTDLSDEYACHLIAP